MRGSSINLDIHHAKVPSSGLLKYFNIPNLHGHSGTFKPNLVCKTIKIIIYPTQGN